MTKLLNKITGKNSKKVALPPAQPRDMETIKKEYGKTVADAGQLQYQVLVLEKDLEIINERLRNLNLEASARQELDKKAQAEATAVETSQQ